ncbi:hypothetical protein TBLA_0A10120 [Henningerozyma blattae CBS 6284]|uniref:Nucleoporin n=1 Tax=Henningerozyma blattae (strain ATCC 34711 / CBS 6284 / DSM 70876 / NBRC 10599 / NRRL Y-10934 / UCD 77-7) TaxID=1071380 RepID=I2GXE0_HENB6|nr:hypothetical protein TBLA_0A10120 [Tetrapisispora blattae CBS 6284]CCH58792.1 hypothetical protein TBLA_0A10120 [Tetrapisispora blattae CBS 6284]
MNWCATPFEHLYSSINNGQINIPLFKNLIGDLENLNLNLDKIKNQTSRCQLEKGEVTVGDGTKYKITQEVIIAAVTLSDELNVDELVIAELILSGILINENENNLSNQDQLTLINAGKVQYFLRRQYILQIVSYIINCLNSGDDLYTLLLSSGKLISNLQNSFGTIHKELQDIKQSVSKAQLLENYFDSFKQNIKFKRDFLLMEYDILSQIQFGLVKQKAILKRDYILKILNQITELDANDFFITYHLPSLFCSFQNLNSLDDNDVRSLHTEFINALKNEDVIYKQPSKVCAIFVFLAYFIGWCKDKPDTRANSIDFKTAVDDPMSTAVELGAIEQLMIFTADTSITAKDQSLVLFYDIRSLLEKHIPRLIPKQLQNNSTNMTTSTVSPIYATQVEEQNPYEHIEFSNETNEMFLYTFDNAIQTIIADCAFLLTKLKDSEEDSLLSGEDFDLNDIAIKADLERFFLVIYFFYSSRPEYSRKFWLDKESNAYGFIEWAAKCGDTLMRACFYLMISSLSFGEENSLNVYHYFCGGNTVSWNIISQCFNEYIIRINNLNTEILQRQQFQDSNDINTAAIALDEGLNEETIIFLSSLLTLISSVAFDLSEENMKTLSSIFISVLFEFCKIETPLIGAALKTLSSLVPNLESERTVMWNSLDRLIFKNNSFSSRDSYKQIFSKSFTNFSEVSGFLKLFYNLIKIETKDSNSKYLTFGKLTFPPKLGINYRKAGIWPYFDYIFNELLINSSHIKNATNNYQLRSLILQIIETSLNSFDYSVPLNSITVNANINSLVETHDFFTYVQETPAAITFNYLFTEEIYNSIFSIMTVGVDELGTELNGGIEKLSLLRSSLRIISSVLDHQSAYIEEIVPISAKNSKPEYYTPKYFGLHGLRSFYDAIFFNLPVVAHLGLYIGMDDIAVASEALQVLKKISYHEYSTFSQESGKKKLLTIFDSVDESVRIKDAFIAQLQNPIEDDACLSLKFEILDFINTNLNYSDPQITIAHFLLGFEITNGISLGPNLNTFITSGSSLLNCLKFILRESLTALSSDYIAYAPIRLAADSLEIILKLCRNHSTTHIILEYLEDRELFNSLLDTDITMNKNTLWSNHQFDITHLESYQKFIQTEAMGALMSFLRYRSYLLQFVSLSLFKLSNIGSTIKIKKYIEKLASNKMYSAKIFGFLDILNYNLRSLNDSSDTADLTIFKDLSINLNKVDKNFSVSGNIYNFEEIDLLLNLASRVYLQNNCKSMILTTNEKKVLKSKTEFEMVKIKENLTLLLSTNTFHDLQLSTLHAWAQLVQIIVSNDGLVPLARSSFILEIFGTIVPMINDYVELNVSFSEEFVSLTVFLYDIYQKDRVMIDGHQKLDSRLYTLFKACISGIKSTTTTFTLRSDFYILANKYLVRVLMDESLGKRVLQDLRLDSEKLVDIICNDAIFGEGINRITSIFVLNSLYRLANFNKENFILESITKNNKLLLLIRSLKNIDILLSSTNNVTIDELLYEQTAFKSILSFLIRVAQNKIGSQLLLQNQILQIISELNFLKIDPDLGLELIFDEFNTFKEGDKVVKLNLNLDNPISIGQGSDNNGISIFEFLVPCFQLITAILISTGSENKVVIRNVKKLLSTYRKLCVGILKRDALRKRQDSLNITSNESTSKNDNKLEISATKGGLDEMVDLIVLLCILTRYQGEERLPTY